MAGEDQLIAGLKRFQQASVRSFAAGLVPGADALEADALTNAQAVIAGMSGATFASINAYVTTHDDPNDSEINASHAAAVGKLQGFTGHNGQPYLAGVPGPKADENWIVLTVPTDYIVKLEFDNAGQKAFLADSLVQDENDIFNFSVQSWRSAFR